MVLWTPLASCDAVQVIVFISIAQQDGVAVDGIVGRNVCSCMVTLPLLSVAFRKALPRYFKLFSAGATSSYSDTHPASPNDLSCIQQAGKRLSHLDLLC